MRPRLRSGFAQALFSDNHDQSHQAVHQNPEQQHGQQIFRAEKSSQRAYKFPVAGAQAAYQDKRQKQRQAQARAQQGSFGSGPAVQPRVHRNPQHEAGNGQPVGNAAAAPVCPSAGDG